MPEVAGVGVVHRWVEVGGGVRVHVAEAGEEGAPGGAVVLLHGFPQHWVVTRADDHADDLTVEVVPGCGHFVHEERPDAVVRAAYALFRTPAEAR